MEVIVKTIFRSLLFLGLSTLLVSQAWGMYTATPMDTAKENSRTVDVLAENSSPKRSKKTAPTPTTPRTPDAKSASAKENPELCESPVRIRIKPSTPSSGADAKKALSVSPRKSPNKQKTNILKPGAKPAFIPPNTIAKCAQFLVKAIQDPEGELDNEFLTTEKAVLTLLEKENPSQARETCKKIIESHLLLREIPDRLYNQTFKSFDIAPHIFKNKYWRELRSCALDLAWSKLRENVLLAVASLDAELLEDIKEIYKGIDYAPMPIDKKEAPETYKLIQKYIGILQIEAPVQIQIVWLDEITLRDANIQQTPHGGYIINIHINFLWYRNFEKDGFEILNHLFCNEENFEALIAHEIGHMVVKFGFDQEYYADIFAALLTSPDIVIQHLEGNLLISKELLKQNRELFDYEVNGKVTQETRAKNHHPPLPERIEYVKTLRINPQLLYLEFKKMFGNMVNIDALLALFTPYLTKTSATATS